MGRLLDSLIGTEEYAATAQKGNLARIARATATSDLALTPALKSQVIGESSLVASAAEAVPVPLVRGGLLPATASVQPP